jgi:hypothetical protein
VACAVADGFTLYVESFNNPVNQAARRELLLDSVCDFALVVLNAKYRMC